MNDLRNLKFRTVAAIIIWTMMMGGFLGYDIASARRHVDELARKEARANFNKDQAFRFWATQHGGVYVPITEHTQPNPALAKLPERDIETPSGKKLTLMNPAYMLRQLMDEFGDLYGIKGKITSFKLMNPANAPDPWEAEALRKFERGDKEVFELGEINGEPYLRLMGAMLVQEGCLKCHAFQGYKVGDLRGGVGAAVPMRPYFDDLKIAVQQKVMIFGVIWLVGLAGIGVLFALSRNRLTERVVAEARLVRQHEALENANAELTQFANISAHHLMEPARRQLAFAQRLRAKLDAMAPDDDTRASLAFIEQGAARMRDLVRDIERYLTAGTPRGSLQDNAAEMALAEVQKRLAGLIVTSGARIETRDLPPLHLDLPRLIDLFEMLIDNALIHAKAGTSPVIRVSGERLMSATRISVEDNGPGIPEEYRQRVFGVFERLFPNPQAGTGIGLAIARRIVESRGGTIRVETSELGGASVICVLPDEGMKLEV